MNFRYFLVMVGFELGLKLAGISLEVAAYVEIDTYCQRILEARMRDGHLPRGPIWDDIRTFDGTSFRGLVDIVTAGFPCQPHSFAGKRKGEADERNLWPDTLRVIGEVGPAWLLLENVPGILANGYGGTVIGQLSELGYSCRWMLLSAAEVGAPHLRKRWWCLAYTTKSGLEGLHSEAWREHLQPIERGRSKQNWNPEPSLYRSNNGTPRPVGELRALGNGVVPIQAAYALRRLLNMA